MKIRSFLSIFLIICMIVGILASCGGPDEQTTSEETGAQQSSTETSAALESDTKLTTESDATSEADTVTDEHTTNSNIQTSDGLTNTANTESENVIEDSTESEKSTESESITKPESATKPESTTDSESVCESTIETESDTDDEPTVTTPEPEEKPEVELEGPYADSIIYANKIKNGVQSYYPDGVARDRYYVENRDMSAEFALRSGSGQKLTYLKNKSGGTYLQDTMDVFIRMNDGKTYYASESSNNARANVYRIGYYYYDVRILEQSFYKDAVVSAEYDIDEALFKYTHDISKIQLKNGVIRYSVGGGDPYISCKSNDISFSSNDFDALQFTIKSENSSNAQLFVVTDNKPNYNDKQSILFNITNDGEFHTYTIMLSALPDYSGNVIGLRLDLGQSTGENIEIKEMKAVKLESDSPYVLLDRTWHTYSDRLHQELHFVAPDGQDNIAALGLITEIAADTVEKIVVKDKNDLHTSLDGVDWDTVEYVGFDIKDAGIFGYIMPADNGSGKIKVTLEGENYVIVQEASPENGEIRSPGEVGDTSNDFFMGQRIYTDESHDFAEFISEAEFERDPLANGQNNDFLEYDALRGAYHYKIGGTNFNPPFFSSWNQHYSTEIKLTTKKGDRRIYIRTISSTGGLENAVLLDNDGLIIPIPLEVSKNFGELEEPVMNYGDETYGETLFPLCLANGEKYEIKVLNLYQNWGKFPIKQLSSIAYYAPYYHLSVGVTETTCISPWYVRGRTLWTLPDFRSQSAPYWFELEGDKFDNSPQHTNAGVFEIIQYTDADGNYSASENYRNVIDSSGPIYANVKMDYISDDGKMKISYEHLELPQTDELRPFYEINIEVLDDVSFNSFKNDFAFYSWETTRTHVGYLDADGNHMEAAYSANDDVTEYVLGKVGGYFGNFGINSKDATNLGFVIHSSEIYFEGQKFDGNFVVVEERENRFHLSLDVGEATFKKGDTITLNIFMVPWGSHLSTDAHNLAYIRQNSVVDPYKVTALKGDVIESPYMPKVKTDDGKSAEFTVSGGVNNAAIRVYGFNKLTSPKIYEKIDGEWVEYQVSSHGHPDNVGIHHYYDGYMTYYDGDGTYSYAFTFSMDGVESRTFKMEASEDFKPWPKEVIENNDPINVYLDPSEIAQKFQNPIPGVGSATVSDEADYVRLTGDGKGAIEIRIDVFSAPTKMITGKYLVVKFRAPGSNPNNHFEYFAGTVNSGPKGEDSIWLNPKLSPQDGEWHVLVVDANSFNSDGFIADSDGKYYANYVSFDVFNTPMGTDNYVDIAYIGLCEDLEKFRELDVNKDVETYTLATKEKTEVRSMSTDELISSEENGGGTVVTPTDDGVTVSKDASAFISSESDYTISTVPYFGRIDTLNGYGPAFTTGTAYNSRGSNSANGVATFKYNGKTTSDLRIVFAGWSLVYGGAQKYVWSVDGKTWYDVELYNKSSIETAGSGMIKYANEGCGKTDFELYAANSNYQGNTSGPDTASGLAADLSDYVGQTVNVTFAVVPVTEPNALCILAHITGIEVSAEPVEEETGGATDEVENPYNDPINYYLDATEMNALIKDTIPAGIGKLELAENGEFLRFFGNGSGTAESTFHAYIASAKVNTGKYIVVKFRMPATNTEQNHLQIFTSTVNSGATAADSISLGTTTVKDDAWHVIVVDAASFLPSSYASEGGRYYCKYMRFDVFNVPMSADSYIDIAYIGFSDNLDNIRQLDANADMETLSLVTAGGSKFISVKTGEITDNADGTNKPQISYVTDASQFIAANNAQGYSASNVHYFSRVDAINGFGPSGSSSAAYDMGSNDKTGIARIVYNGASTEDKKLVMAGWSLVEGGIEKYVWSADGGKTWNDVVFVGISSASDASSGMLTYCANKYGSEVDFSPNTANSCYQTSLGTVGGLGADLSAFAGQTVDVTFAVVPATDTDSLCILLHIEGVTVAQ